tara:strand:- start:1428 stop:2279 length:852 start_codon:yes stop_codon:yes gene_type:complete
MEYQVGLNYKMKYEVKIVNQSVRGKSHVQMDIPCQDKTYFIDKNNIKVISLADGAGSCKYSEFGAEIATKVCGKYLVQNFSKIYNDLNNEFFGKELFEKIKDEIIKNFKDQNNKVEKEIDNNSDEIIIQDFSSTLLFLAFSEGKYISGHIGDGIICINNEELKVLSNPENGETSNSTYFFTSKSAEKHLRLKKGTIEKDTTFILMSDGTHECIYDKKEKIFTNAILKFIDWIANGKQEEVSEAIESNMKKYFINKTSDDCSISIMHVSIIKSLFDKISDYFKK